ncbi:MAG: galactosyldiacylglycerol synthase [Ruminococcus sp.]|nr:galactosyldiacylglycerol synthase [Ruminococcus sp.]
MKVLIFSASTGGGHKRAATALKEYIESDSPENIVKIVDGLELAGKLYNNFICGGYTVMAKKMPKFYGNIYRNSDRESALNNLCNSVNKFKSRRLVGVIEMFKPDVIVSCHAFTATMLGDLKNKGKIKVPVIALITDYASHYTYIADGIDHYIVSSQKMVDDFQTRYNISPRKVHAFGIPVFQKFLTKTDKSELRTKLRLKPDSKTVLFMAGSFGVNEVLSVYKDIANSSKDCQFIVITGNNPHLFNKFRTKINSNTHLLMYVDNVEDYMHCSDLIITKPGGLTVSESLTCGLPMAIYSAYPGQEADNAKFLSEIGVAVLLSDNAGSTIQKLLNEPRRLSVMSERCRKAYDGSSSKKICELAYSLTENKK